MSIIDTGRQLDEMALRLLSACTGHTLRTVTGYTPFGDAAHIYKTARLDFGEFALDLRNAFEHIIIGPDYAEEDFATLSVNVADGHGLWHPAGRELACSAHDFPVADVLVVVDTILLTKGSRHLNRLKLTQTIALEDPDGQLLVFDRDIWSDEYLTIRQGPSIATTTRDFRGDFVAEPPYAYRFGRDIQRLSAMRLKS